MMNQSVDSAMSCVRLQMTSLVSKHLHAMDKTLFLVAVVIVYSKQTEVPETATNTVLKVQNNVRVTRVLLVKINIEQSFF